MGTITKRENGRYQVKVRRAGYPAQSMTFDSEKDAKRWLAEREGEISKGEFVDTKLARETTVGDLIDKYLLEVTPKKKGAEVEEIRLKALKRDKIAGFSVFNCTPAVVAAYRDRRLKSVSGSTVNRDMNLLHHVFEKGRKDWGVALAQNPVSGTSRPVNNPPRSRRLAAAEEVRLLAEASKARNPWLRPMVELALETGMRQGELRELLWPNVDLEERVAVLPWGSTKTNEMRGVPLSSRAVEILRALPSDRAGRVFPGLTKSAVAQAFNRLRKRAKVDDLHFHDTRHEATSRFIEKGFSTSEVMAITGHKTNSMMQRYTHLNAKKLAKKLG